MTPEEATERLIQLNHWNFINGADKDALRKRTKELFEEITREAYEDAARIVKAHKRLSRGYFDDGWNSALGLAADTIESRLKETQ